MTIEDNYNFSIDTTWFQNITEMDVTFPTWQGFFTASLMLVIIIIGVVGNSLVVLSVYTDVRLRIAHNYLLASLAASDLGVAFIVMPLSVAHIIFGKWYLGFTLCKIWLRFDILVSTASIYNLCAITLDRYWAVTDPINYVQQRSLKRVKRMISVVWIVSAFITAPTIFGWNDWDDEEKFRETLVCSLIIQREYTLFSALGSFFIPGVSIVIFFVKIIIAIWRKVRAKTLRMNMQVRQNDAPNLQAVVVPKEQAHPSPDQGSLRRRMDHCERSQVEEVPSGKNNKGEKIRNMRKLKSKSALKKIKYLAPKLSQDDSVTVNESASGSNLNTLSGQVDANTPTQDNTSVQMNIVAAAAPKKPVVADQRIRKKQRISMSKESRAVFVLAIVMGVFLVCWTPFFAYYINTALCPSCYVSPVVVQIITWLGYTNSALNPFIYTMFNKDFRRSFKKLLNWRR